MALTVRKTPLAKLTQYPGNPRRGNVELIAESLKVNGQYKPIVVQKSTGHILAGNHTALAAESLGWDTIAAVTVDVDDDEARRIVLADNRTADMSGHDDEELLALLKASPALDGTGYSDDDIAILVAYLDVDMAAAWDEDAYEAAITVDSVSLKIDGLTTGQLGQFRKLPGASDLERLLGVIGE